MTSSTGLTSSRSQVAEPLEANTHAKVPGLRDAEWNFLRYDKGQLPNGEVFFACIHEYFRVRSDTIRNRLKAYGKKIHALLREHSSRRYGAVCQQLPNSVRALGYEWPAGYFMVACGLDKRLDDAWLEIPINERTKMLAHYCAPLPKRAKPATVRFDELAIARGAVLEMTAAEISAWGKSNPCLKGVAIVRVDLQHYSLTQIAIGVQQALRQRHEEFHQTHQDYRADRSGRQGPMDLLMALRAWRVFTHTAEIAKAMELLQYADESSLRRAVKSAKTTLQKLELSGWISDEFQPPMCFPYPYKWR